MATRVLRRCINLHPNVGHPWHRLLNTSTPSNPVILRSNSATVHLLGTMHIAQASAVAARDLIQVEHSKGTLGAIFLELDKNRHDQLSKTSRASVDESLLTLALSTIRRAPKAPLATLVELAFTTLYRTLHQLGFASGIEFKAAIEAASRLDIPLVLGDQHIFVTTSRLADAFKADLNLPRLLAVALADSQRGIEETVVERTVREAFQAVASGDVKKGQRHLAELLDHGAVHEMVAPMRRYVPSVSKAILDERDVIMARNLAKAVEKLPPGKRNIVAIVGLAHVEGIIREWEMRVAKKDVAVGRPT